MGKTKIQWTASDDGELGETLNPTIGCDYKSPGCRFCYAATTHNRRFLAWKRGRWPDAPKQYHKPFWTGPGHVQLLPERLETPFRWRKPRRVFVNSMSDLWHDDVPDWFIARTWAMMALTPQHTYQILTKRPERMLRWFQSDPYQDVLREAAVFRAQRPQLGDIPISNPSRFPLPNVWLGVSVEDQAAADERIPLLLETPAAVRFLSCEPLLGPVDLRHLLFHPCKEGCGCRWPDDPDATECACGGECQIAEDWGADAGIQWCIIGGESGSHARPLDLDAVEDLLWMCRSAGIAPFVKQLGTIWAKTNHAKDHHGGAIEEWPEYLRIREFPTVREAVTA